MDAGVEQTLSSGHFDSRGPLLAPKSEVSWTTQALRGRLAPFLWI